LIEAEAEEDLGVDQEEAVASGEVIEAEEAVASEAAEVVRLYSISYLLLIPPIHLLTDVAL
jgi:hypothetical protein